MRIYVYNFAITLYSQNYRRHVVGQQIDIDVIRIVVVVCKACVLNLISLLRETTTVTTQRASFGRIQSLRRWITFSPTSPASRTSTHLIQDYGVTHRVTMTGVLSYLKVHMVWHM